MIKKTNLDVHIHPFFTRVEKPTKLIDIEVLERCVEGLNKRLRLVRNKDKRSKLKIIKSEIQALINSL